MTRAAGPSSAAGILFVLLAPLVGCASDYAARTKPVRQAYETKEADQALTLLAAEDKNPKSDDALLVLLDRGTILHTKGSYEESIKVFLKAEKLADQLNFTSIGDAVRTVTTTEGNSVYRGEDFERLLINVYQALNFKAIGNTDGAMVEVRKADQRLRKMIADEKKPYEQLAIARYLGGVLYENDGDLDNAFIDYAAAAKASPGLGYLANDLLRIAKKTGRDDAYKDLRKRYPQGSDADVPPDSGQLVVVLESGLSPEKRAEMRDPAFYAAGMIYLGGAGLLAAHELSQFPVYRDRPSGAVRGITVGEQRRGPVLITSLSQVATKHLDDRVGRLLLKRLASTAVKAGVGVAVAKVTDNELLGLLTFVLLSIGDSPDLRSWLSLPAAFQVARFVLPAGKHEVRIETSKGVESRTVEIRPRRVELLSVRTY